jgi:hypothetical protein
MFLESPIGRGCTENGILPESGHIVTCDSGTVGNGAAREYEGSHSKKKKSSDKYGLVSRSLDIQV